MDKCPKCGSPEELGMIQDWSCGSIEEEDESVTESETCLRRQLAAANERAGRLEKALEFYADTLKHNLMGEVNEDHGAIARKALEVPDA